MKPYPILCLAVLAVPIAPRVGAEVPPRPTPSPALLDSAWAHLSRRVGTTFAAKYLTLDQNDERSIQYFGERPAEKARPANGKRTRRPTRAVGPELPVWRFDFRFRDPERPSIDELVSVTLSLEEGLSPWTISFHWYHSPDGRFVWVISNTLSDEGPCAKSGKSLLIDANTGVVSSRLDWGQEC